MNPLDGLRASRPASLDPPPDALRRARHLEKAFAAKPLDGRQEPGALGLDSTPLLLVEPQLKRRRRVPIALGVLAVMVLILTMLIVNQPDQTPAVSVGPNLPQKVETNLRPRDLSGKIAVEPLPAGFQVMLRDGKRSKNDGLVKELPKSENDLRRWAVNFHGKSSRNLQIVIYSGDANIVKVLKENFVASSVTQAQPVQMPYGEAVARRRSAGGSSYTQNIVWELEPGLVIYVKCFNVDQDLAVAIAKGVKISP
jgi:hypothetical protein